MRRRLTGEKRGSFPLAGSNWWVRPVENTQAAWRADLALLAGEHRALKGAVMACAAATLARRAPGSSLTYGALIRGAAAHDLYHAGQVQLLKRLAGSAEGRGGSRNGVSGTRP